MITEARTFKFDARALGFLLHPGRDIIDLSYEEQPNRSSISAFVRIFSNMSDLNEHFPTLYLIKQAVIDEHCAVLYNGVHYCGFWFQRFLLVFSAFG